MDVVERAAADLELLCSAGSLSGGGGGGGVEERLIMSPQSFEKDDDSNGHIDFITAASVSSTPTLHSLRTSLLSESEYSRVGEGRERRSSRVA